MRVIDGRLVRRLLTLDSCIQAMADAMAALSSGTLEIPLRQVLPFQDGSGQMLVMPGVATELSLFGAKLLGMLPGNPGRGRPAFQGVIVLLDQDTGVVRSIVDAASVTALRTAAVSGLATRLLGRPDARSHGVLGTGVQAAAHIEAIIAVRPALEETLVWGRDPVKAARLASEAAARTGRNIRAVKERAEAAVCDIVTTVTGAAEPILDGAMLRAGCHLNVVGSHSPAMREVDTEAVRRAEVFVDTRAGALSEAGDLIVPIAEGAIAREHILAEIGEVVLGRHAGRSGPAAITLYKSLGTFAQDLFAAALVTGLAERNGEGGVADWSA